jgi:hypothetical protein
MLDQPNTAKLKKRIQQHDMALVQKFIRGKNGKTEGSEHISVLQINQTKTRTFKVGG